MHFVAPDSSSAWCGEGEIMVSAFCTGSASASPVAAYVNGAKCGYGDASSARAHIMCMPASAQQGSMSSPGGASQMASLGLHLVSSEDNKAACGPDEAVFSAYCSGGYSEYPLLAYPGGGIKCGYSGGLSKANVACIKKDESAVQSAGMRVVASDTNTAWCNSGETVISAYCTGGWSEYPLETYPNGAKCGYSDGDAKATVICSASTALENSALRLVSGSNSGSCDSGEKMISAYCAGTGSRYPLQTYANSAKCGYSGDASTVTLLCMKM